MYRLHRKKGARKDPFIDARVNMQAEILPCSSQRYDETRDETKAHVARKVDSEKLFRLNISGAYGARVHAENPWRIPLI